MERPTPCPAHQGVHKTGCPDCRTYARHYHKYRHARLADGTWDVTRVPVEPVRAHLRTLIDHKMTIPAIACRSGVTAGTVRRIRYMYDVQTCRRTHAEALLAVGHDAAGRRNVDGTGTRRRIQALMTMGWSQREIGARLGAGNTVVSEWAVLPDGGRVLPESAEIVEILYSRIHAVDGPCDRVRRWAERRGWAPPEAWSEDTIGDPDAEPGGWCLTAVDDVAVRRALRGEMRWRDLADPDRAELIRRLIGAGHGLSRIRVLARVGAATVHDWCTRTGFELPGRSDVRAAA